MKRSHCLLYIKGGNIVYMYVNQRTSEILTKFLHCLFWILILPGKNSIYKSELQLLFWPILFIYTAHFMKGKLTHSEGP